MRYKTELRVNLTALKHNIYQIRSLYPNKELVMMAKANAYGHGDIETVSYCLENALISHIGVATLKEGLHLRQEIPSFPFEISVFSETLLGERKFAPYYRDFRLIPVIHTLEELKIFLEEKLYGHVPLWVKINTGMNRLGIRKAEFPQFLAILKKYSVRSLDHLLSHFSNSQEMESDNFSYIQEKNFLEMKNLLLSENIVIAHTSMANSGSIMQKKPEFCAKECSFLRPGMSIYGGDSYQSIIPCSSFYAQVLDRFSITKGERVGYGKYEITSPGTLLLLACGYGDGPFFSFSHKKWNFFPYGEGYFWGRVSMDMMAIFFKETVEKTLLPKQGEFFEIWGERKGELESLAREVGLISYVLTTGLNQRIQRVYKK